MTPQRKKMRTCRGAILVATLVSLLLTTTLLGTMLHAALSHRRQLLMERDVRQTELLVSSGVRRATNRLAAEPDYRGETWQPSMPHLAENSPPTVTIEIARDATALAWRVKVSAESPVSTAQAIRRTRTIVLPFQTTTLQESSP